MINLIQISSYLSQKTSDSKGTRSTKTSTVPGTLLTKQLQIVAPGRNITNMHKRFLVEYIYYMIWKKLHSVNYCKNALTVGGNDK